MIRKGKKAAIMGITLMLLASLVSGCGQSTASEAPSATTEAVAAEQETEESRHVEYTVTDGTEETIYDQTTDDPVTIRVGSLKGPTSLGILSLMDKADQDQTMYEYEFQMASAADELLPLMIKGDLDIALVPANVASVLYNKTDGGICVIDINTLGVLYVVTGGDDVASIEDLKGKTIYLTGKGTTPEASLRYVLAQNGLSEDDYTLEFQSEATEVAAILAEDPDAIGLLPQPFVTAALMQNDALQVVLDLNEEWKKVTPDAENGMVTGVTVVRKEFYQEHFGAVANFLEEHAASVEAINADPATGATLAVEAGIVAKEPIAEKAIPQCNLTCITGDEMEQDLSAYLTVLYDFNAELVGGTLPGEDFYTRVVEAN